jgi:thiol-disulfide isomerase/thioredoxin
MSIPRDVFAKRALPICLFAAGCSLLGLAVGCGKTTAEGEKGDAKTPPALAIQSDGEQGDGEQGDGEPSGENLRGESNADDAENAAVDVDGLLNVPDGTPQELIDYIVMLGRNAGHASSREQHARLNEAVVVAAEKILAAPDADDVTQIKALTAKQGALNILAYHQPEETEKRLTAFAAEALERGERILSQTKDDDARRMAGQFTLNLLAARAMDDSATEADVERLEAFTARCIEGTDDDVARQAFVSLFLLDATRLYQGKIEDPAPLIETAVAFLDRGTPGDEEFQQAIEFIGLFEQIGHASAAIQYRDRAFAIMKKSESPMAARFVSQFDEMPIAKRLALPGSTLAVEGRLADGSKFDWSRYQGKVVLIDFWATWCGPCLASLPELKKVHAQFAPHGFEVVGVSLDSEQKDLDAFLARSPLPWPVVANQAAGSDRDEPNAVRCGVEAIPMVVLVGADGKVIATGLHGEKLVAKLEELLGAAQPPADGNRVE